MVHSCVREKSSTGSVENGRRIYFVRCDEKNRRFVSFSDKEIK